MLPRSERTAAALGLGLLALMAAQLFWRLGEFPGLHGDEAWVGLFALRLKADGLYTPHEMNTYTGALYGWLLVPVFERFGVGVRSLRLVGAVANPLAWLTLWAVVRRAAGARAALAGAALAATSGIVVLKSRVAWEVYALQPLFVSLALAAALRLAEGGGRRWALLLFAASLLGVQNHFIFLSLPLALAGAAALLAARGREAGAALAAALVNVVLCAALFIVKPLVTEASWPAVRAPLLAAFFLAPAAGLALLAAAGPRLAGLTAALAASRPWAAGPWPRRTFMGLLAVCIWFHALAFVEIQSGVAVARRLSGLPVPWALALPLYGWGAAVLWAAFSDSWRRAEDGAEGLAPGAALLAVLPVVYAAVFILFRNTSSIRYYVIPCHLALAALAASWPRRPGLGGPRVLAAAAAGALGALAVLALAASGPTERPPIRFRVGWHREKSHDFLGKADLYAFAERERLCVLAHDESMIDIPLIFRRHAAPIADCDQTRALRTRYCSDCSRPPFIIAEPVSAMLP
jgi:hypothetical protein